MALTPPNMEIEDIFDKDDLVDLAKLKQLLYQSENIPESSNIKKDKEDFDPNSFLGKESNIKKEEEECDIPEDSLELSESKDFTLVKNEHKEIYCNANQNLQNVEECSENVDEKIDISEITLQISGESKLKFECENDNDCQRSSTPKQSPESHLLQEYEDEIKNEIQEGYPNKNPKNKITHRSRLNVHSNSMHNKQKIKKQCQFCDKSYLFQMLLDDHLLQQHKEKINQVKRKIHHCHICSFQTTQKVNLDMHLNSVHNDQRSKINCQFCDKSFLNKCSLDDHTLKHHNQNVNGESMKTLITNKIHTCNFCSYKTTLKSVLINHIESTHNKQRIKNKCQFCDKSFAFKYSLDDHLLKHHEEKIKSVMKDLITSKIYLCNSCSYKTTIKNYLNEHMNAMHNDQRIRKNCKFCIKSFVLQVSLNDHLLKQHKTKITTDMKDLMKNKIHTCNICPFQTTLINGLNKHVNSVHNKQKIIIHCQFCNKTFKAKQSLDDHMLKKHKNEIELDSGKIITSKIHKCNSCTFETTLKRDMQNHKCKSQL